MNYVDNNVTFRDILKTGLLTGGNKISSGEYSTDSNGNISAPRYVVNAIDIDWCNAQVDGIDDPIKSTGQLLNMIAQLKKALGNIAAAEDHSSVVDRLTALESAVSNLGNNTDIPDNLKEQLESITMNIDTLEESIASNVSSLNSKINSINSKLTSVENTVNSGGLDASTKQQIDYLTTKVNNFDDVKHIIIEKERYEALTSYEKNALYFVIGEPDYVIVDTGGAGIGGGSVSTKLDLDSIATQLTINGKLYRDENIILQPGDTYIISGTLAGTIVIDTSSYTKTQMDEIGNTEIILSDVIIVSEGNYGILYKTPEENKGYKDLIVTLTKNTTNVIYCKKEQPAGDNQFGALHSMNNLVVRGTGYLAINNKGGHGIRSTELDIAGPHIYCNTAHDAIHGKYVYWDWGTLYVTKANDAIGTGTNGSIIILGGDFYISGIEGQAFDSKQPGLYNKNISVTGTKTMNGMTELNPSNFAMTYSVNSPGYVYTWPSKTDYINGTGGVQVNLTNNAYRITDKQIISVSGVTTNPIIITLPAGDATVYLTKAYCTSSGNEPTIYYNPGDGKGKLKIMSSSDTFNVITNTYTEPTFGNASTYECDAVKSENNGTIEIKNGSHLLVSSTFGDGIDVGSLKIADSKGTIVVTDCGMRGLKGNVICIGANYEAVQSVIQEYYKDESDTEHYTTFDGLCIVKNNCKKTDVGQVVNAGTDAAKNSGFADIYARNGKASKGEFGLQNAELNGAIITGSVAAVTKIDMDNASNMYYNTLVTGNISTSKIPPVANETIIAYDIYKQAVS